MISTNPELTHILLDSSEELTLLEGGIVLDEIVQSLDLGTDHPLYKLSVQIGRIKQMMTLLDRKEEEVEDEDLPF